MTTELTHSYICRDCGRKIVVLVGERRADERCGACLLVPGWWKHEERDLGAGSGPVTTGGDEDG